MTRKLKIDELEKVYMLRDKYYPMIEKNLPKNERTLLRHIGKYRDKNMPILSSPYLTNYPVFSQADEKVVFDACGINIVEMKKDTYQTTLLSGKMATSKKKNFQPIQILLVLIMRYYILTKQQKKLNVIYHYYAYSIYWSVFTSWFRKYLPREGTMIYTIDNLSNKFIIKQLKSLDAMLFYAVDNTIKLQWDRIISSSDGEISYIIDGLKTKVNNYFGGVAKIFYENHEKGEIVFRGEEFLEDGSQRDVKSIGGDVEMLAQELTTKFFSEPPRQDIINQVSRLKGVSSSELRNTLTLLVDEQLIEEVKSFYESIFFLYFSDDNSKDKNVKSMSFLGIMESIYKKGNSNDKNIRTIKELMNKWLDRGSTTYRATSRLATQNDFRKAIYYYFIFLVSNNK